MTGIGNKMADRRGVALLIALAVLATMLLMAVPFAAYMRMQHRAGTQALQRARARYGEEGAVNHARAVLNQGLVSEEQDESRRVFPFDDPYVDTRWEFTVTLRTKLCTPVPGTIPHPSDLLTWPVDPDNKIPEPATPDNPHDEPCAFVVDNALGFPHDKNMETVDGYIRVTQGNREEWMGYTHLVHLDPEDPDVTYFPGALLVVPEELRALFSTEAQEFDPSDPDQGDVTVSLFPENQLWALQLQDQQGKINVNSAPYQVLVNVLTYAGVATPEETARAIYLDRYYVPPHAFTNLNMIKRLSDISAEDYDNLRPLLTTKSGLFGARAWEPIGELESAMVLPAVFDGQATKDTVANLGAGMAARLSPGSVVRFTHTSGDRAYRTVLAKNTADSENPIQLVEDISDAANQIYLSSTEGWSGHSSDTPGYFRLDEEWIEYVGIGKGEGPGGSDVVEVKPPPDDGRGAFGSTPAKHKAFTAIVDADVISWANNPLTDIVPLTEHDIPALPPYSDPSTVFDDLDALSPKLHVQSRHPVNINTVRETGVLVALMANLSDRDGTTITADQAEAAAEEFLKYISGDEGGPPYAYDDGDERWFEAFSDGEADDLEDLVDFVEHELGGILNNKDQRRLLLTALDPFGAGSRPAVSSLPACFCSDSRVAVGALAQVESTGGALIAQAPGGTGATVERVYEAVQPNTIRRRFRSQQDFRLALARNGSTNLMTGQLCTLMPRIETEPEYKEHIMDEGTPGERTVGVVLPAPENFAPGPYTTALLGVHRLYGPDGDRIDLDFARGTAEEGGETAATADNTTAWGITGVRVEYPTDYDAEVGLRNVEADTFHATMQPFAVEFWIRPPDPVSANQLIFEIGNGSLPDRNAEEPNQFAVYLSPGRNLTVRITDQMYDETGRCVQAQLSSALDTGWQHVAIAVCGTFKHEIGIFVDGVRRDVDWSYGSGLGSDEDENSVAEGYFCPVAMTVPNRRYMVAPNSGGGPGPPIWMPGSTVIELTDYTDLPDYGFIAIGHTVDDSIYEYEQSGGSLQLNPPLRPGPAITPGTGVSVLIPVVQSVAHNGQGVLPQDRDWVAFWGHTDLGNGSYESKDQPTDSVQVQRVFATDDPSANDLSDIVEGFRNLAWSDYGYWHWLVIEPDDPKWPLTGAGAPTEFPVQERWKVFDYDAFVTEPQADRALAGTLPTGKFGGVFVGSHAFTGQLDELRISALPTVIVPNDGWSGGEDPVQVTEWHWHQEAGLGGVSVARLEDDEGAPLGARLDLVMDGFPPPPGEGELKASPLYPTGGYIMVLDDADNDNLYSYESYTPEGTNRGQISGLRVQDDDFTPSGGGGLSGAVSARRRMLPLNFLPTTRLAADLGTGPEEDLFVSDDGLPPRAAYVRIGDEMIAYRNVEPLTNDLDTDGQDDYALRRYANGDGVSAYPRGAFDGAADVGSHSAGDIVRYWPVRARDRYRLGDPAWSQHEHYDEAQLAYDMCMLEVVLPYSGWVHSLRWKFADQPEPGYKVAVLVRLSEEVPWKINPLDVPGEGDRVSEDLLWGKVSDEDTCDSNGWEQEWTLLQKTSDGEYHHPYAGLGGVQVRFYWDMGRTDGLDPPQLDELWVEMVPETPSL